MSEGFNDFSALKNLKKELLEQERSGQDKANRQTPQKRPHTVVHKSKAQHAGEQKARELNLKCGSKVTLMDSNDRGILRQVYADHVEIELDGLVITAAFSDFVVNDPDEDRELMRRSGSSRIKKEKQASPVVSSVSNQLTVDLHIERIPGGYDAPQGFELPFQLEYFKRILRSNLKHRGMRISFIHGVGDGILKEAIRKELDETFAISCSWTPSEAGVTIVTIK